MENIEMQKVHKKITEGLSLSFNIKHEHDKLIVWLANTLNNQKLKGQSPTCSSSDYMTPVYPNIMCKHLLKWPFKFSPH